MPGKSNWNPNKGSARKMLLSWTSWTVSTWSKFLRCGGGGGGTWCEDFPVSCFVRLRPRARPNIWTNQCHTQQCWDVARPFACRCEHTNSANSANSAKWTSHTECKMADWAKWVEKFLITCQGSTLQLSVTLRHSKNLSSNIYVQKIHLCFWKWCRVHNMRHFAFVRHMQCALKHYPR